MNLANLKILITRPRLQADEFAAALRKAGAIPVLFPVIEIGPIQDLRALDRALVSLARYDWLVLTSVNGVEALFHRMKALGLAALPEGPRVAAIGPKTARALRERGVAVAFMPAEYVAEAILPGLGDLHERWVLLLRADIARPALARAISAAGGIAHEIPVYHTLPVTPDSSALAAIRSGVHVVTFTSSSTVRNFVALVRSAGLDPEHLPGRPLFACIGPVTRQTAREYRLPVAVTAGEYTTDGLLEALKSM
jgi:uroporphyrinogen-III synthase